MTDDKDFKKLVRQRAAKTGESYRAAREQLRPSEPKALALAEKWMEWQQLNVVPLISTIFWNQVRSPPAQRNDKAIAESNARLPGLLALIKPV